MQKRLGKGLDALLPKLNVNSEPGQVSAILLSEIQADPDQPRKFFEPDLIKSLAASIAKHGLLQPLVLTRNTKGGYHIVAGERRYRAAKEAGLKHVPAIVRDTSTQQRLELALVENLQRENLNPLEEANAFMRLKEEFGLSLKDIGQKVSKDVTTISNKLRLLQLPPEVLAGLLEGHIFEGHARALLPLEDRDQILLAYAQIRKDHLSVRQVETLVGARKNKDTTHRDPRAMRSSHSVLDSTLRRLQSLLGTKVKIAEREGKGHIRIEFYSREELTRIVQLLASLKD